MKPDSESELAAMVAGLKGPVRIAGGATRGATGPEPVLSTAGLSGISLHEPGALTLVAGAGTPLDTIESTLAAEGQRLAFEPMDHRALLSGTGTPTIGGVVAANVSGPRRVQAGGCRDFLLGVRFVDGSGVVIRNGGRVMKNVTGYDMVKLMAGSWGTLGVLSEVALKVLPRPEMQASIRITGLPADRAVSALSQALGSPYEVSGAAHLPDGPDATPLTAIRIEGFEDSVRYRADRLIAALAGFGDVAVDFDQDSSAALWTGIRDVTGFAGGGGDVWRISVKPSDGPLIGQRLSGADLIYDWGGGLVWARVAAGTDLRALVAGIGGHATLVRGDSATRARLGVFAPQPAPLAAISAGLRARFDPRGIFNPGLMG